MSQEGQPNGVEPVEGKSETKIAILAKEYLPEIYAALDSNTGWTILMTYISIISIYRSADNSISRKFTKATFEALFNSSERMLDLILYLLLFSIKDETKRTEVYKESLRKSLTKWEKQLESDYLTDPAVFGMGAQRANTIERELNKLPDQNQEEDNNLN